MTRSQVRAQMRRLREQHEEAEEETGEINLVPYMDIVTNIIIFLLASVVTAVPLGRINATSPVTSSGGDPSENEAQPKQDLNLTVTAGASGFTVAARGGVLPVIPKKPTGEYDFKALTTKLVEIKADPSNAAEGETKANFNADADVPYQIVVDSLDAMRMDAKGEPLFPDINFAAGVQ